MLGEIVRKLPDSDIEIELKEHNTVYIKCENSHFKINSLTADEFPELPEVIKENGIILTQNKLKEMIRQTIFSVSTDEISPILTGVLFEVIGDKLSMVALDGFRMAVKNCGIINDNNFKAVIPGKSLIRNRKDIRRHRRASKYIFLEKSDISANTRYNNNIKTA